MQGKHVFLVGNWPVHIRKMSTQDSNVPAALTNRYVLLPAFGPAVHV